FRRLGRNHFQKGRPRPCPRRRLPRAWPRPGPRKPRGRPKGQQETAPRGLLPAGRGGETRSSSRAPPSRPAPRIAVPNGGGRADPSLLSPEVNVMGKSFRSRPQLEVLEDRLPPGGLHGGLSPIGAGAQAAGRLGQDLNRQVLWDTATGQAAASAAQ